VGRMVGSVFAVFCMHYLPASRALLSFTTHSLPFPSSLLRRIVLPDHSTVRVSDTANFCTAELARLAHGQRQPTRPAQPPQLPPTLPTVFSAEHKEQQHRTAAASIQQRWLQLQEQVQRSFKLVALAAVRHVDARRRWQPPRPRQCECRSALASVFVNPRQAPAEKNRYPHTMLHVIRRVRGFDNSMLPGL